MSSKQLRVLGLIGVMVMGLFWTIQSSFASTNQLWFTPDSPKISPNETLPGQTGAYNSYCYYPVNAFVDSNGNYVLAADAKFFAKNLAFSGTQTGTAFTQYLSSNPGFFQMLTGYNGLTQPLVYLYTYSAGSELYQYINATVDFGNTGGIQINSGFLSRLYLTNSADVASAELAWYYVTGSGDDSKVESGAYNQFANVISGLQHFTGMTFVKWPCILDTNAPIFTGQQSGQTVNAFVSGFQFTVYDWTGSYTFFQSGTNVVSNSTIHYYWNGGSYVPSFSGIDNQDGVNTGCIALTISGTSYANNTFTGEAGAQSPFDTASSLFAGTSYNYAGLVGWLTGYQGEGSGWVWTGQGVSKLRGYSFEKLPYLILDSGANGPQDNQVLTITVSACDYPNQNGSNQTGTLTYTTTLTGFDKTPPYKVSEDYTFTSWDGASDSVWAINGGSEFTTAEVSAFTGWTSGNVNMNFTGNETIQVLTGTITGNTASYLPMSLPLLASDTYSIGKTIVFTGNFGSGWFQFIDNPTYSGLQGVNTGWTILSGTQAYAKTNVFHVFWIDRTTPDVNTGSDYASGAGTTNLYLSGNATGFNGSTKDDEFKVIDYTGTATTPPLVGTWASFLAADDFTDITVNKLLTFNADWSGCLVVRDRAYNTTNVCVQIFLNTRDLNIYAYPELRFDTNNFNGNLTSSGDWFFWNTGAFASMDTGNYISSGHTLFSSTGLGVFSGVLLPVSGDNYLILYKSESHLSAGFTGNDSIRNTYLLSLVDLVSYTTGFYDNYWFKKFLDAGANTNSYLVFGDVADVAGGTGGNDIIGSLDLAALNNKLTVALFSTVSPRYDANIDGYVNALDQAALIQNSARVGFWHEFKGLGLTANPETTGSINNYPWRH